MNLRQDEDSTASSAVARPPLSPTSRTLSEAAASLSLEDIRRRSTNSSSSGEDVVDGIVTCCDNNNCLEAADDDSLVGIMYHHRANNWTEERVLSKSFTARLALEQQQEQPPQPNLSQSVMSHYYSPQDLVSMYDGGNGTICDNELFSDYEEEEEEEEEKEDEDDLSNKYDDEDDDEDDYIDDDEDICEENYRPSRSSSSTKDNNDGQIIPALPYLGSNNDPYSRLFGPDLPTVLVDGSYNNIYDETEVIINELSSAVATTTPTNITTTDNIAGIDKTKPRCKLEPEEEGGKLSDILLCGRRTNIRLRPSQALSNDTSISSRSSCSGSSSNEKFLSTMKKQIHNKQNEESGIISGSNIEQQLRAMNLPDRSPHKRYDGYQHMFITVRDDHRFLVLYTFLQKYSEESVGHRIILFFLTNESTVYYTMLLRRLKFDVDAVYVGMTSSQITNALDKFAAKENGIDSSNGGGAAGSRSKILCIPNSFGKDVIIPPSTNWIVQFEPCSDPSEYIYRIGRVSHTHGGSSGSTHQQQQYHHQRSKSLDSHSQQQQQSSPILARALLFLTPNQYDFHKYYKAARIKVYEYEISTLRNIQSRYLDLLKQDDSVSLVVGSRSRSHGGCKMNLRQAGEEAYFAYLSAYARHEYKDIYNKTNLDVKKVALCFGFDKLPSKSKSHSSIISHSRETTASWMPTKNKKDVTVSWMKREEKSWGYAAKHVKKK